MGRTEKGARQEGRREFLSDVRGQNGDERELNYLHVFTWSFKTLQMSLPPYGPMIDKTLSPNVFVLTFRDKVVLKL